VAKNLKVAALILLSGCMGFAHADVTRMKSSVNREETPNQIQENLILPYFLAPKPWGLIWA
jgi:hypothetical protein